MSRHAHLGIDLPNNTLADLVTTTAYFADVANESLTVDDLLAIAILTNNRCYLLGEAEVRVRFGNTQLLANWADAANYWKTIHAMIKQINSEVRSGQRYFNAIRTGELIPPLIKQIESSNASIDKLRIQLATKISEFQAWYDKLVGRP
jgi:hypothetical protein